MFEYAIVVNESCAEMLKDIRKLLDIGWRPQGGVVVGYRDEWIPVEPTMEVTRGTWNVPPAPKRRMYWVQAMVRDTQTEELHHPVTYRPLEVKTQDDDDEVSGTGAER